MPDFLMSDLFSPVIACPLFVAALWSIMIVPEKAVSGICNYTFLRNVSKMPKDKMYKGTQINRG